MTHTPTLAAEARRIAFVLEAVPGTLRVNDCPESANAVEEAIKALTDSADAIEAMRGALNAVVAALDGRVHSHAALAALANTRAALKLTEGR